MDNSTCYIGEFTINHSQKKELPDFKVAITPWYHWAVYVNDTVYEVSGNTLQEVIDRPCSQSEFIGSHRILVTILLKHTIVVDKNDIKNFIEKWISKHPHYYFWSANCQTFGHDFAAHYFGVLLPTQMSRYESIGYYILYVSQLIFLIAVMLIVYGKYFDRYPHSHNA